MRVIEPSTKSPRRESRKQTSPYRVVLQFEDEWPSTTENCLARHADTGQWYLGCSEHAAGDWACDDWRPVSVADALAWFAECMRYSNQIVGHVAALCADAAQLLKGAQP